MKLGGPRALGNGETQRTVSRSLGENAVAPRREARQTKFAAVVGIGGPDLAINAFPALPLGANGADLSVRQRFSLSVQHSAGDRCQGGSAQFEIARVSAWKQMQRLHLRGHEARAFEREDVIAGHDVFEMKGAGIAGG